MPDEDATVLALPDAVTLTQARPLQESLEAMPERLWGVYTSAAPILAP